MQLLLDNLKAFFETISGWVWGPIMLMLLVGTGILLTVLLKGLQFTMLGYALKQAFVPSKKHEDGEDHEGDISHFAALMTALSATIGTGNIAGVATAVVTGGPGAVFWMWMTAIFGMATKYGEGVLAVKYRVTNSKGEMSGGPMYYIEKGLGKTGMDGRCICAVRHIRFLRYRQLGAVQLGCAGSANQLRCRACLHRRDIDRINGHRAFRRH